jgi:hypothetical protein
MPIFSDSYLLVVGRYPGNNFTELVDLDGNVTACKQPGNINKYHVAYGKDITYLFSYSFSAISV